MLRAKHFKDGCLSVGELGLESVFPKRFSKLKLMPCDICTEHAEVKMTSEKGSAGAKELDHPST